MSLAREGTCSSETGERDRENRGVERFRELDGDQHDGSNRKWPARPEQNHREPTEECESTEDPCSGEVLDDEVVRVGEHLSRRGFHEGQREQERSDRPELTGPCSDEHVMSERAQAFTPRHEPLSERLL